MAVLFLISGLAGEIHFLFQHAFPGLLHVGIAQAGHPDAGEVEKGDLHLHPGILADGFHHAADYGRGGGQDFLLFQKGGHAVDKGGDGAVDGGAVSHGAGGSGLQGGNHTLVDAVVTNHGVGLQAGGNRAILNLGGIDHDGAAGQAGGCNIDADLAGILGGADNDQSLTGISIDIGFGIAGLDIGVLILADSSLVAVVNTDDLAGALNGEGDVV